MKIKTKHIAGIVFFIVVLFALDYTIGWFLQKRYFNNHNGIQTVVEDTKADVLVFGSSEATHHYVPDVFEKSMNVSFYNTGLDGSCILYQTAVLKSVLKRYKPKMIILDSPGRFEFNEKDYAITSEFLFPFYKKHPELRETIALREPYMWLKNISAIYPYNSKVFDILMYKYKMKSQKKNKGYVPLHNVYAGDMVSEGDAGNSDQDSVKIKYLANFFSLAHSAGVKLVVCYSPAYRVLTSTQINETAIVQKLCNEYKNQFFDYRTDTAFIHHKELFQDGSHMNENGAILFSGKIVSEIK